MIEHTTTRPLAEQHIETMQAMYEAFGTGDLDTILAGITDDVDWSVDNAPGVGPWYGARRGKQEVAQFFADLADTMDITDFTPVAWGGNADGDVFVRIHWAYTVRATGRSADMHLSHYWQFRDGKICFFRGIEDSAQTAAVLSA
jgi:ketosteroid isomerase-like protein